MACHQHYNEKTLLGDQLYLYKRKQRESQSKEICPFLCPPPRFLYFSCLSLAFWLLSTDAPPAPCRLWPSSWTTCEREDEKAITTLLSLGGSQSWMVGPRLGFQLPTLIYLASLWPRKSLWLPGNLEAWGRGRRSKPWISVVLPLTQL